ncbi:Type IV secretion system protein virB9 precursor [compost metagenome]
MRAITSLLAGVMAIASMLIAPFAGAETMGRGSFLDGRVQTATYSPDDVYRVQAVVGRTALVQLQYDESVNTEQGLMVTGDPAAWSIGVNQIGNLIGIKPVTNEEPNTNLIISTNRRTYVLELKLVPKVADSTYVLRWDYPELKKAALPVREFNDNPCSCGRRNTAYKKQGDLELSPTEVWDNGTFTCLRFSASTPRPVLYQVLPDGTETLTNTRSVGNVLVVHGVSKEFRLRLNDQVLALQTRQIGASYNYNGTTTDEYREVKSAEAK